jgi:hypothetical protein
MGRPSCRASTAEKVNEDHDDRDHQKNMDKATEGVGSDEPEGPQYEQNNRDRIEHGMHLFVVRVPGWWLMYLLLRPAEAFSRPPNLGGESILQSTIGVPCNAPRDLIGSLDGFTFAVCSVAHTTL